MATLDTNRQSIYNSAQLLRGFQYADLDLRNRWLSMNKDILTKARQTLDDESYKNYFDALYKTQIWKSIGDNASREFPGMETINNELEDIATQLEVWATKSPLYNDDGTLSKDNPYWTPEEYYTYTTLDELGKKEFLEQIQTLEDIKRQAASKALHDYRSTIAMQDAVFGGPGIDWSGLSQRDASEYIDSKDHKYLQHLAELKDSNKSIIEKISNRYVDRVVESEDFQSILKPIEKEVADKWNSDLEEDPNSKTQHLNNFIDAYSGKLSNDPNSILSHASKILQAASGEYYKLSPEDRKLFDRLYKNEGEVLTEQPSTEELKRVNTVGERMWSLYREIEEEQSDNENMTFQLKYISMMYALDDAVTNKRISLDDAKRVLDVMALRELDKHEVLSAAGSAVKGLATLFVTHELDMIAPFANEVKAHMYNNALDKSGRGIYLDVDGNIYPTKSVDAYGVINDDGNGYIFVDSEGNIVNALSVEQDEDGLFVSTTYNGPEVSLTPVRKVTVGERKVDGRTLVSLGHTDEGEVDGSVFNPIYLSKADRYNVMPYNREELDFWDLYGVSKYTAILDPTKQFSTEQFLVESVKMGGFIIGDMLNSTILGPLGAVGESIAAVGSATAIADAYRRGVVEENMMNNREKIQQYIQEKASEQANDFVNSDEGKLAISDVLNYRLNESGIDVSTLTDDLKMHYLNAATLEVRTAKTLESAHTLANSPEMIDMMNNAMGSAVQSSYISFWGEALKYGAINKFGWRGSLFKGASPIERAVSAGEAGWFGRLFERVARATLEDVNALRAVGKTAVKEGDLIIKEGWDSLSRMQKLGRVGTATGWGLWGGGWTNWTDEMLSAGAKAFNDAIFSEELENPDANGAYLLLNAIAAHNIGAALSALAPTSLWAFGVGAAGGYLNIVPNANALSLLTASGRKAFFKGSIIDKIGTLVSNQLIQDITTQKYTDRLALEILDNWNNLNSQIGDSLIQLVKILDSASKLGHSENYAENEEITVRQFFRWMQALENFSKNNPGLVEFDKDSNIQNFKRNAEALINFGDMSEEDKTNLVNLIAAENKGMTLDEALAEIPKLAERAKKLMDYADKYNKMVNSKAYRKAASNNGIPTAKLDRMDKEFELKMMKDLVSSAMLEREKSISGLNAFGPEIVGDEDTYLSTWGSTKKSLNQAKKTLNFYITTLQDRINLIKNKDSLLNYDAKVNELVEKIDKAPKDSEERKQLVQQLEDLNQDHLYYQQSIANLEKAANDTFQLILDNLSLDMIDAFVQKDAKILNADQILKADPITRMRMLNPLNFDNYNARQQKEITKANELLKSKGITYDLIVHLGLGYSRLQQYNSKLADIMNNKTITPSFTTYMTNMQRAAANTAKVVAMDTINNAFKEIEQKMPFQELLDNNKMLIFKALSNAGLDWVKPNLRKADLKLLEEVRPLVRLADLINDIIYGNEFEDLTFDEKLNILGTVNSIYQQSNNILELIDGLANINLPSILRLLNTLDSAYQQLLGTTILSAKESASLKKAQEEEAAKRRDEAAKKAIDTTPPTTPVTPVTATSPTAPTTTAAPKPEPVAVGPEESKIEMRSAEGSINPRRYSEKDIKEERQLNSKFSKELAALKDIYNDESLSEDELDERLHNEEIKLGLPTEFSVIYDTDGNASIRLDEPSQYTQSTLNNTRAIHEVGDTIQVLQDGSAPVLTVTKVKDGKIIEAVDKFDSTPVVLDGRILTRAESIEARDGVRKTELSEATTVDQVKFIIAESQKKVQSLSERDPHADFYMIDGQKYTRMHGIMSSLWLGSETKSERSERALTNGAVVDGLIREFFNGNSIVKPDNMSDLAFSQLTFALDKVKSEIDANGETFLANNIVLYHEFPNGVKLAGEVDILSVKFVDGKPEYRIYDIKTSAGDKSTGASFTKSKYWETESDSKRLSLLGTKDEYTQQLNGYNLLLNRMFGVDAKELALLPFTLEYVDSYGALPISNNIIGITAEDRIPIAKLDIMLDVVAYRPLAKEATDRIKRAYPDIFNDGTLEAIQNVLITAALRGEKVNPLIQQLLSSSNHKVLEFNKMDKKEFLDSMREFMDKAKNLNSEEVLKEEAPEIAPVEELTSVETVVEETKVPIEYTPETTKIPEPSAEQLFADTAERAVETEYVEPDEDTVSTEVQSGKTSDVLKGNVMSPYVFKDSSTTIDAEKQDALRGVLREKDFGETMSQFYGWLKVKKIRLADIIDSKLADILSAGTPANPVQLHVMKLNPKTLDSTLPKMDSIYFLVTEYNDNMKKKYTQLDREYYGEPVKANGKEWIIVGTMGWSGGRNVPMQQSFNQIALKGPQSVLQKSNAYFRNNTTEEAFVDESAYTEVALVYPGWLVKQTTQDDAPKLRNVSELLADRDRNPNNLDWSDLKFGILLPREFRTIGVDSSVCYSPTNIPANVGNVFLMIQGADGKYAPAVIKPTRFNEINDGSLKNRIMDSLRLLTSPVHQDRYNAMIDLYQMLVFGNWNKNGYPEGNYIDFGTETVPIVKLYRQGESTPYASFDLSNPSFSFNEFLNRFNEFNPRININRDHLTSEARLMELDEAGALQIDIARLTKGSADYTIYNVGKDGKPVKTVEAPVLGNGRTADPLPPAYIMNGRQYFKLAEGRYRLLDDGSIVTDPYKIQLLLLIEKAYTLSVGQVAKDNTVHYIIKEGDNYSVISLDRTTYEPVATFGKDSIIAEYEASFKEKSDATRDAAAEETLKPEEAPKPQPAVTETPSLTPTEYVNDDDALTEILEKKPAEKPTEAPSAPKIEPKPTVSTKEGSLLERNLLRGLETSEKSATFAGEQLIAELFNDMDSELYNQMVEAIPEIDDMSVNEFIEKVRSLKDKNGDPFPMTGITDKKNWFETLKGCWL